jgi:glutamate synthase domain-containing protein 3
MSGGEAYVLDEARRFKSLCNPEMIDLESVEHGEDQEHLHRLLLEHFDATGSANAARVLDNWDEMLPLFVKVMPRDYKRVLAERQRRKEALAVGSAK